MADKYFYLPEVFDKPSDLQQPTEGEIKSDTQNPHLNAVDSQNRIYDEYTEPSGFLPFFCFLDCTDDLFIVGTNNFTAVIEDSNLLGTPDFSLIANANRDASRVSFQKPELHNLTCAKFLDADTILTTTSNHQMQLLRTNGQQFSSHHTGGKVKSVSKLVGAHKFVLANKFDIQIFDYGLDKVWDEIDFENAHGKEIAEVSAHPTSAWIFATCAADRNCVKWDCRGRDSASYIYQKFENQLTAVHWTTQAENKELVMVGDEIGNLLALDPRSPNQIISKVRVSNRGIRKIIFNGTNQFAVIARSNKAYILQIEDSGEHKVVYEHVAPSIIYDFCWDRKDSRKFYVVGEHRYAAAVEIFA